MFFINKQLYASRPFFAASYLKDSWCSNYALFMLSVVPLKTFFPIRKNAIAGLATRIWKRFSKKLKSNVRSTLINGNLDILTENA